MIFGKYSRFPPNDSSRIFTKLLSGSKVAIAGLNISKEIDQILVNLKTEYKEFTVFCRKIIFGRIIKLGHSLR